MSPYEKILAELRELRKAVDRLGDKMTLLAPRGTPVTEWSCGHFHATRGEAAECLRAQRMPLRSECADDCTHPSHRHEPFPAG